MNIIDLSQSIAGIQQKVVDIGENVRKNINNNDRVIKGLSKEVDKNISNPKKGN